MDRSEVWLLVGSSSSSGGRERGGGCPADERADGTADGTVTAA